MMSGMLSYSMYAIDGIMQVLIQLTPVALLLSRAGLPLWSNTSISVAASMIAKAQEKLGSAVIAYELGNEPA